MNRTNRERIADAVKAARAAQSMTQGQLAEKVGVHAQTIGNLERALVQSDADLIRRIETVLGISLTQSRLAARASANLIRDELEKRLDLLSEGEALIFVGEVMRFVSEWEGNGRLQGTGS